MATSAASPSRKRKAEDEPPRAEIITVKKVYTQSDIDTLPANLKKLKDDIDAREAQAAEWRKQKGFDSVPRKDIVVTMFQAISLDALEEKYGRLTVSAAMKEHTIHYDENTVTLRVNSKAIKYGTFIQTVAHGEDDERMTCLTPEGTRDVHVDKEGRIFDEAKRWRCDVRCDSQLSQQSQGDIETQVRSDCDSEISETQELELPEGLEVVDDQQWVACDYCGKKNINPEDLWSDKNLADIGGGYAHESCMTEEQLKEWEKAAAGPRA